MVPGSLGGDGHCLLFQPLEPPTSDITCPCRPTTGHQLELVVVSMSLLAAIKKKKKTVRDLTFKKTAGMSEILTDTSLNVTTFVSFQHSVLKVF